MTADVPEVHGRVLDISGRPVPDVNVVLAKSPNNWEAPDSASVTADSAYAETASVRSGADGRFSLPIDENGRLVVHDDQLTTVFAGHQVKARTGKKVVIIVARRLAISGRVVDVSGIPVPNARVELNAPGDLRARLGVVLDYSSARKFAVQTDENGTFQFAVAPAIPGAELTVRAEGFVEHAEPGPQATQHDVHVVLTSPDRAEETLEGIVVDASGNPVSEALVSMGIDSTVSDEQGRFSFDLDYEDSFNRMAGQFMTVDATKLLAVKSGYLPGELISKEKTDAGKPIWSEKVVLRLGGEPLALGGIVVDEDGEPLAGMRVWITDPTFFGGVGDPSGRRFPRLLHLENILVDADPGRRWMETGDDGVFRIDGLLDRAYTVPLEWGRHIVGGLTTMIGQDIDDLVITIGRRCSFQVEIDNPEEADRIAVLDQAGEELEISEFLGKGGRREGRRQMVRNGRSNPLGVADTAATVVLYKGDQEVRRIAVSLTAGELTVVR